MAQMESESKSAGSGSEPELWDYHMPGFRMSSQEKVESGVFGEEGGLWSHATSQRSLPDCGWLSALCEPVPGQILVSLSMLAQMGASAHPWTCVL